MKQIFWIFLTACLFPIIAHSQTTNDAEVRRQEQLERQRRERDIQNRLRNLERIKQNALNSHQKALIIARMEKPSPETKEQRALVEETLSPHPDDSTKYKTFLKQSNTGLFRLFPDFDCQPEKLIVRVDGDCENQIPGTWFYSFRQKNYSNEAFFDVRLKDENLIAGGFFSQGILVQLGDIPLKDVSLESNGIKFLVDFRPETQNIEIEKQFLQISKGIESDGYEYRKTIKASENMTYAMRIVAYRSENKPMSSDRLDAENLRLSALSFDNRKDLILTFRIIRREAGGNITILWKELKRKDSPKLIYEKRRMQNSTDE